MAGPRRANPDELYLEWLVPYVPSEVETIARNEAGKVIARDQIETAGKPGRCSSIERKNTPLQRSGRI